MDLGDVTPDSALEESQPFKALETGDLFLMEGHDVGNYMPWCKVSFTHARLGNTLYVIKFELEAPVQKIRLLK